MGDPVWHNDKLTARSLSKFRDVAPSELTDEGHTERHTRTTESFPCGFSIVYTRLLFSLSRSILYDGENVEYFHQPFIHFPEGRLRSTPVTPSRCPRVMVETGKPDENVCYLLKGSSLNHWGKGPILVRRFVGLGYDEFVGCDDCRPQLHEAEVGGYPSPSAINAKISRPCHLCNTFSVLQKKGRRGRRGR